MKKVIAIDIGGTFIKHGLLDELGNILDTGKKITDKSGVEKFTNELVEIIDLYKSNENIVGVSISMPGFINNKEGIPIGCSIFRFIENYKLKDAISKVIGLPVKIENDANCVALAEKFNGNAVECDDFICITIGTGIGGGIYLNGDLVRGKQFKGGEFCYMITKDEIGYQRLNENSSMTGLINMYKKYKNIDDSENVFGDSIFEEAETDNNVKNIINIWYENIARMIYNVAGVLNPEKILIGGGISAREDLIKKLNTALNKIEWWHFVECKIEKCKHENYAGLIGATYNFFNS